VRVFENRVQRRISRSKRADVIGSRKVRKNQLQICTFRYANENGTACSTHGVEEACISGFVCKAKRNETTSHLDPTESKTETLWP
jgi:hypothetical protein